MAKEDESLNHMPYLQEVVDSDVEHLRYKESKYKGSWKKRGGAGAFMMLARKWDRIEVEAEEKGIDIFQLCTNSSFRHNEVGDLRRYLMLVEAEMRRRGDGNEEPLEENKEQALIRANLIGEKEGDPRI